MSSKEIHVNKWFPLTREKVKTMFGLDTEIVSPKKLPPYQSDTIPAIRKTIEVHISESSMHIPEKYIMVFVSLKKSCLHFKSERLPVDSSDEQISNCVAKLTTELEQYLADFLVKQSRFAHIENKFNSR